jgi:hypothetical protein
MWSSQPSFGQEVVRDACVGRSGSDQLACIQSHYPKLHDKVEAKCAGSDTLRKCRVEQYGLVNITFVPAKVEATDAATSDASPGHAGGQARAGTGTSEGGAARPNNGSRKIKLDPTAVTTATIGLTLAGATMQQAPTLCRNDPKCKLSPAEQTALARYGGVVVACGAQIPTILGSDATDAQKVDKLLVALQELEKAAPTGLSSVAENYVQAGVTAARAIVPLLVK